MDVGDFVVKPLKDFAKNSSRLVKRCTKPDRKGKLCSDPHTADLLRLRGMSDHDRNWTYVHPAEFFKVLSRTAIGFVMMGFIGFFVKLLFIVS